jgi:hypothetical protein
MGRRQHGAFRGCHGKHRPSSSRDEQDDRRPQVVGAVVQDEMCNMSSQLPPRTPSRRRTQLPDGSPLHTRLPVPRWPPRRSCLWDAVRHHPLREPLVAQALQHSAGHPGAHMLAVPSAWDPFADSGIIQLRCFRAPLRQTLPSAGQGWLYGKLHQSELLFACAIHIYNCNRWPITTPRWRTLSTSAKRQSTSAVKCVSR